MSKKTKGQNFPLKPTLTPLSNSLMNQNQYIDSLTSHISFYHSHSLLWKPDPSTNLRSSILKWFSSLSIHQRQAHLTIVEFKFVQILIQMLGKIRTHGHGFFIILPDLPSRDPSHLPSVCFKKSRGLLSRVAESNESEKMIFESVQLFGSSEGEKLEECSCSVRNIDSMTMSEDFIGDLDRFVKVMDEVSNGGFLKGEETELGSDWFELNWLKSKGYYSIEAFVANRIEVALRLAWVNCNGGKKRGVKLKEKMSLAGMSANVFCRKKGCLNWWDKLDAPVKRKVLTTALAKSAKSLTEEILKWASSASENEKWLFNTGAARPLRYNSTVSSRITIPTIPADSESGLNIVSEFHYGESTPYRNALKSLSVLQDIIKLVLSFIQNGCDKGNLFFSTFGSIFTISDCILRKLREFLMFISLDCTKFELLGEENNKALPSKSKEKPAASSRRKKVRTHNGKRQNSVQSSCVDGSSCDKSLKVKEDLMESSNMSIVPRENKIYGETSSTITQMENGCGIALGQVQAAVRKTRKEKHKNKKSGLKSLPEVKDSERLPMRSDTCSSNCQDQSATSEQLLHKSFIPSNANVNSTVNGILISSSRPPISANEPSKENNDNDSIGDTITPTTELVSQQGPAYSSFSNGMIENQHPSSRFNTVNSNALLPTEASELNSTLKHKKFQVKGSVDASESGAKSTLSKLPRAFEKEESLLTHSQYWGETREPGSLGSLKCSPYEWPSVAPFYFPSINTHLPTATDRLHLDVGFNWYNHFHHSLISTMHQARSSPLEGTCNPILTRPLPMSLDWPPMVRGSCGLASSMTCNYDPGFISRRQSAFEPGFSTHCVQLNSTLTDDEKYSGEFTDSLDLSNAQEVVDECDGRWISEEEFEVHAVSGIDYNQYFGGGVMYWNPSEHHGTGFSRPPSLSSDDSSWAWHEADMNRAVDDMVAFSSSYSTNGLTSPTAASFCSPFDPLGYVIPGNEVTSKVLHSSSTMTDTGAKEEACGSLANLPGDVEGMTRDSLPYPILRPIIIPSISRERSRSEFKRSHDHKSPCVPPTRREHPRIKRPPSPVVLCVPQAPRPPPPSPVSDSRKQRGFPTVRSGSSSPRNWGMKGWYHEGTNSEEGFLRMYGAEVVWPSWRNSNLSNRPMIQPLSAALLQDRLIATSTQISRDQEHPDVALPLQPPDLQSSPRKDSLFLMHNLLHDEIESFCKHVTTENMSKKPYITWAVKRVTRSLQVLWPRSRTNIFGSNATGLSLPTSDVDLVVCLPPVRNLEPIKEAGILEGRNGIKETCLQHAARCLGNQDWVKSDSLKTVENTAIPIIMLVVEVPHDLVISSASNVQSPKDESSSGTGEQVDIHSELIGLEDSALPKCTQMHYDTTMGSKSVRLDISFKTPSHTGMQTTELVKELTGQFPAVTPLALVLKQFLADRSLDQSYSGGLSSYCLVLLITRFLQHEHHLGRPINQNFGSLLMDFLYFFGNVFDPRQMRISVQGSGLYIKRERGYSIDPIHIDDPLFPLNNVGRNCFRIHQCIKAFSEAYSVLENESACLAEDADTCSNPPYSLLQKIIPSINLL